MALLLLLIVSVPTGSMTQVSNCWVSLFDGESLRGWKLVGGEGAFSVEGGSIVGESVADTPNSFLRTEEDFSDFVLELEVSVDEGLNSGIQIRSAAYDKPTTTAYKNGRGEVREVTWAAGLVHGYQIEIDTSSRAWSGGVYEEAERGWLLTLEGNEEARQAFRNGEWNYFRIQVVGSALKVWVNGTQTADLKDSRATAGFVALQLHSVQSEEDVGKKVQWRNIRICPQ